MNQRQMSAGLIGRPAEAGWAECIFCGKTYYKRMPFDFILILEDKEMNGACTPCLQSHHPDLHAAILLLNTSAKRLQTIQLKEKEKQWIA